jgi:hypothetical protein
MAAVLVVDVLVPDSVRAECCVRESGREFEIYEYVTENIVRPRRRLCERLVGVGGGEVEVRQQ